MRAPRQSIFAIQREFALARARRIQQLTSPFFVLSSHMGSFSKCTFHFFFPRSHSFHSLRLSRPTIFPLPRFSNYLVRNSALVRSYFANSISLRVPENGCLLRAQQKPTWVVALSRAETEKYIGRKSTHMCDQVRVRQFERLIFLSFSLAGVSLCLECAGRERAARQTEPDSMPLPRAVGGCKSATDETWEIWERRSGDG